MNVDETRQAIERGLPELFSCSAAPEGAVRVRTPITYPDGGLVDIFIVADGTGATVTDFGEAFGWVRTQTQSGRRSSVDDRLVADACQTLGVTLDGGQLTLRPETSEALADAVLRVAQTATRICDRWLARQACWDPDPGA